MPERAQLNIWKQLYPDQTIMAKEELLRSPFSAVPFKILVKASKETRISLNISACRVSNERAVGPLGALPAMANSALLI